MNISKRTIICAVVAIIAIVAALASLYYEKEAEIRDLEEVAAEPKTRRTKKEPEPEPEPDKKNEVILNSGSNDDTAGK